MMSIYRGRSFRDLYLASILYDAVDDNNIKAMILVLEKSSDPNLILPLKGITAFHRIIGCDSLDFTLKAVCLVLQFGGDPNVKSDDGLTPLHIAAAWGRPEVLQILLSCGGDPEAVDFNNLTPIDYAMKGEFTDCVYLLKSYLPVLNLLEQEQEDCCKINLNKVLINNGLALGEYHIISEQYLDLNNQNGVNALYKENFNDIVLNWFNKCENTAKRKISVFSTDNEICEPNLPVRKPQKKSKGSTCINIEDSSNLENISKEDLLYKELQKDKLSNESGVIISSTEQEKFASNSQVNYVKNEHKETNDLYSFLESDSKNCDKSDGSDYKTCPSSILEKNIFEITEDLSCNEPSNQQIPTQSLTDSGFIAVSEIYKYEDKEEGIILFEKRIVKTPSECSRSIRSGSFSSKMSSLPDTFDYDTDTLRMELTSQGFVPGPITLTTKRLYLKKLYHLKKIPISDIVNINSNIQQKKYSVELEKTRKSYDCFKDLSFYKSLEDTVIQEFSKPNISRKWREGLNKSSFTYMLLDPRVTKNLPCRSESLEPKEVWDVFLSSVFYIGKGKKTRPYSHLYDAVALWKDGCFNSGSTKLKHILDIWKNECGVICLHVFHNVIPVEAYTREAAMIAAITLENLTNAKSGDFYGIAATWPQKNKKSLGVYLLYKAMQIFLQDGERQIYPIDIE